MNGLLIGRVRGVELRLNWSMGVIAALVTWSLADSVFPEHVAGRSVGAYWLAAGLTTAAFFAGLVAHELGHALVALKEDVKVSGITLWLFGGIAQLESPPTTPRSAFRISVAGPVVSAVLGLSGVLMGLLVGGLPGWAISWFGFMNLILAGFNLLPAFPLDGGRIYQAWRWSKTGDQLKATEEAAGVGVAMGAVLVGIGVVQILFGLLAGGLWLILIGWFVREAAQSELRGATLAEPLAAVRVSQVMHAAPLTVNADITVHDFVAGVFFGGRHAAYPVIDSDGGVIGLITLNAIRKVLPARATSTTIGALMTPLKDVVVTSQATPIADLLREMAPTGDSRALVFDDEVLVGIVAPSDLNRLVSVVELATSFGSTSTSDRAGVTS